MVRPAKNLPNSRPVTNQNIKVKEATLKTVNQDHPEVNPVCLSPIVTAYGGGDGEDSQARITCEYQVATGLDFLKINLHVDWILDSVFERLEATKKRAQEEDNESEPVVLNGKSWNCMRNGTAIFPYRLRSGDVTLLLNRRKGDDKFPNLRVEIGSMSCWLPGYKAIRDEIEDWIQNSYSRIVKEQVSEFHITADLLGVMTSECPLFSREQWVSRAKVYAIRYDGHERSGINLDSKYLRLRIYDKTLELRKNPSKQEFFKDQWKFKSFDEKHVTRIEFQIRRPVIRDFEPKINTVADLEMSLEALWAYCTQRWCYLASEPVDRNHHQSRSEVHPFWEEIQQIQWQPGRALERSKKQYLFKDPTRIHRMFNAFGMSVAAFYVKNPADIEMIIAQAQGFLESGLRQEYRFEPDAFTRKMQRKINEARGLSQLLNAEDLNAVSDWEAEDEDEFSSR